MIKNPPAPLWLLAELTYRCPLQCPYCSNPQHLGKGRKELSTDQWLSVLEQARNLGSLQIGFSGGEPLLREDIVVLVKRARELGYYTNLITSGVVGNQELFEKLKQVGLDHIQVSFESKQRETDKLITGSIKSYDQKISTAKIIKSLGYPLVFNCVLHKHNIDQIGEIIEFANELEANYVELANTQYYGWAFKNISELLPSKESLDEAKAIVEKYRIKYPKMEIIFVVPDYYENRPKPCMQGLGNIFLAIDPSGDALPCHSASILPIKFPNVKEHTLDYIWKESDAFNHFRGYKWMEEPCRSCPEREKDFGGCRCQAYQLTGNMHATDPVCDKSPHHLKILEEVKKSTVSNNQGLVYRNFKNAVKPF